MKLAIIQSVKFFQEGKLSESISKLNGHFREHYGAPLIDMKSIMTSSQEEEVQEFGIWVATLLKNHWAGYIRFGLAFRELWEYYPHQSILEAIWEFDISFVVPFSLGFELAVHDSNRMSEMYGILQEGLEAGLIGMTGEKIALAPLPTITESMFHKLNSRFMHDFHSARIFAAVQSGVTKRKKLNLNSLPEKNYVFICRWYFSFIYFSPRLSGNTKSRSVNSPEFTPELVRILIDSIRALAKSSFADDQLSDFVYEYTCGRVFTFTPRDWLDVLAESIDRGESLIPVV